MAKRRKSAVDDFREFCLEVPWWVGLLMTGVIYLLSSAAVWAFVKVLNTSSPTPTMEAMLNTFRALLLPLVSKVPLFFTGMALLAWTFSLVAKAIRRGIFHAAKNIEAIRALHWQDFERLVGEFYRRQGFQVEERGGTAADGGVDLVLRKGGEKILVQCKHWKQRKVGVKPVRELAGVFRDEFAQRGIVLSSGEFTREAHDFATRNPVALINGQALVRMIDMVKDAHANAPTPMPAPAMPSVPQAQPMPMPACPRCGSRMVVRTSRNGPSPGAQFYGCSRYPACKGIINAVSAPPQN